MKSLVGKTAVDFSLADTEGNLHSLKDGLGNWQLLVFHRQLG